MARHARILRVLGALAAGALLGPAIGAASSQAKADGGRRERARLRAELTAEGLPRALEAARRADARAREDLTEALLDREDLLRVWLRDPKDEDLPFLAETLDAAFLRKFPSTLPALTRDFDEVKVLFDSLDEARTWSCSVDSLDLDELAAEIRWTGLAAFPFVVDPLQPIASLTLGRSVYSSRDLGLFAWIGHGIPLAALAAGRAGERPEPALVVAGGDFLWGSGPRTASAELVKLWRAAANPLTLRRIAAAALALELSPFDAAAVETLTAAAPPGTPESRRAAAAYEAILDSPRRGASLLGAIPKALDGFGSAWLASPSAAPHRAWRVLESLPATDASGRSVNAVICQWHERAPAERRAFLLAVLAARRSSEARPLFEDAVAAAFEPGLAAALSGLRALGAAPPPDALGQALDKATTGAAVRACARALGLAPGGPAAALSRLDRARGARRGALLAALLAAAPSDAARRGAEAVLGETDPEVLTELHAALCVEPPLHRDPEAFERLTRAAAGGSLGALLALDGAGAFPPGSRDAFAEALLRDPGDALLDLRAAAAGRIASRDWILARLRKEYPASKSDERLTRSLSHLTGELWRRSSRIERSEIADTLSAGDNAPDDARIRRPGGRVLFLTDLARLFAATGQLDLVAPQGLWFETRRADQVLFPYRLSFERGSPFPAREHLLDALVP